MLTKSARAGADEFLPVSVGRDLKCKTVLKS
jgi:hypothetical protein